MHSNFVPFGCCRLVDFTINFGLVVIRLFPGGWSIFVDGRHGPRGMGPVVTIEILSLRLIGERHNSSGSSSVDGHEGTLFSIFVDGGLGPLGLGPVVKIEILSLRLTDKQHVPFGACDVGGREGTRCLLMFYGVSTPGYLSGVCLAEGISASGTFRIGHIS